MAIKDLMVHLDHDERTGVRLGMAVDIARRQGARLVGLFGQCARPDQIGVVASWPPADYVAAAEASRVLFDAATAGLPDAVWRDVNRGAEAAVTAMVVSSARCSDLVVLGQHDEAHPDRSPAAFAEQVLEQAGRPVLVVPYTGHFHSSFQRPLIAWNHSRESARALHDALPLMKGCEEAIVLSVDSELEAAQHACAQVVEHLACHGIKAQTDVLVVENAKVMDTLLNTVVDQGADLLVMGAHGHIGFPFLGRGSGTRYILSTMTVPVLMAN